MLQKKREWNAEFRESSQLYVPLKQLSVEATIRSFAANVTITQIFRNDEDVPIEAVYCFPIEEQAAVYSFVARIGDREVVAELKEKKQAQREYDHALREHHGAYMLEQDEDSQDNFIINVGALPPNQECQITISYVTELDLVQNGTKIRFVVPTTIAPRYNPNRCGISSPTGTTTQYVQSAPYTIEFHCSVEKYGISRVSSMSHPIEIDFNQEDVYRIKFAQENTHLDRDIIMDFELAENRSSTIIAVESGAIMASFMPTEEDCRRLINDNNITNEFIFIVDCSGSMGDENKIGLARQAMLLFLKNLPVGCHFNIIRFGSDYKSLFSDMTTIYNEDTVQQAEQLIQNMKTDLGGTELLPPLKQLKENPPIQGRSRQVFLLSDGEISNVDEVINLCRSMASSTRIFSFGLGHAPSRSLIKGLARATNGRSVFIPPGTYVDVYVGEQLQKALQPCITNVQIKLNLDPTLVSTVPTSSPPIFINDRLIVYAVLNNDKLTSFDHDITLELYSEQHRLCEANVNCIPAVSDDGMIARLAAKALILELQHSKDSTTLMREKIIEISLKHNILSPYTAFVGIEKRVNANNNNMVLREVPIQISADNQYLEYLKSTISQMQDRRHERADLRYASASSMRHYVDELCGQFSRLSHPIYRDHQHAERQFTFACKDHDRARERLNVALTEYDDARQHYNSADTNKDEAKKDLDRTRNNYEEARKRLDASRRRYNNVRKDLDQNQMQSQRHQHDFNRAFRNDHYHQHNFDRFHGYYHHTLDDIHHVLSNYDRVQDEFDRAIHRYDEVQQQYDDVIESIDKSYQNQQESSADTCQQLSQHHKNEMNSVEKLFKSAQMTLEHCENKKSCIDDRQREVGESLEHHKNEMRASVMEHMRFEDQIVSSEIHHLQALMHQEREKQSSRKSQRPVRNDNPEDLDIVRRIIAEQKFDGLWNIDVKFVEQLTGKSFTEFQQLANTDILISAIIIIVLETRFASLVAMWHGMVQKARKRLLNMLDSDSEKFTTLFENIRKQL